MYKSKLGISVGAIGAAAYFIAAFSGYVGLIMLVGFVLLFEENGWLKKTVVKAISLLVVFDIALMLINFIPNVISSIDDFLNIFNGSLYLAIVSKITNFLSSAVIVVQDILFVILGLKALTQGTIPIKMIDSFINKHMD